MKGTRFSIHSNKCLPSHSTQAVQIRPMPLPGNRSSDAVLDISAPTGQTYFPILHCNQISLSLLGAVEIVDDLRAVFKRPTNKRSLLGKG
jgi:hypothetical protein